MKTHMEKGGGLATQVYEQIEADILSGKHQKGAALTELSLSEALGVSRTPIRAALVRLEQEGLVRLIPNKGAVVLGISTEDLCDIYRIRMRLEGLAASLAAEKRSEEDAARLSEIVELSEFYVARGDAERLRDLDSDFHEAVYLASGSRVLETTLSDLHRKVGVFRARALGDPARVPSSIREHRAILEAILARDPGAADRLAAEHAEHALRNILQLLAR